MCFRNKMQQAMYAYLFRDPNPWSKNRQMCLEVLNYQEKFIVDEFLG